ncbi:MAG: hypothetical protein A2020_04725 [Lentisphaerae bacterium GWF2_45_14]|nr:MAG: hypothetical protein A2020_04725 [Lentisphaerae bacterium GWF2_45_14]
MISDWLDRISPVLRIAGQGTWGKGHVEAARCIYDHEFVYFANGDCELEYGGRILNFSTGSWAIIEPGILHASRAVSENVRRYWIHFDWVWHNPAADLPVCAYAPAELETKLVRPPPAFVPHGLLQGKIADDSLIPRTLDEIISLDTIRARALFLQVLIEMFLPAKNRPAVRSINENQAFRLKELLDRMPSQNESVRQISQGLGMSYEHVERIFKSCFGVSPLAYLNRLRIERAKGLLSTGRYAVSDAALASGFNDNAYFSRAFRKHTGISPSGFIRKSFMCG